MEPIKEGNERQDALNQTKALITQHRFTAEELFDPVIAEQPDTRTTINPAETPAQKKNRHLTVSEAFYNIGALIMLSGAWALVGINWGDMDSFGKIASSLAVVVFTYLLAIGTSKVRVLEKVSPALFLAAIGTVPVVAIALVDAVNTDVSGPMSMLFVALFSGLFAVIGWALHKLALFVLAQVVYLSIAYLAVVQLVLDALPYDLPYKDELVVASFVLLGLIYIGLAYVATKYKLLLSGFKNLLYGFGALFIYIALFTQTGWSQDEVTAVGLLYPVIIFAGVIVSVILKQPSILLVATVFLAVYIIKTTFLYFSDNIGWPVALMLSGVLTIAIGIGANLLAKRLGMTKKPQSI